MSVGAVGPIALIFKLAGFVLVETGVPVAAVREIGALNNIKMVIKC